MKRLMFVVLFWIGIYMVLIYAYGKATDKIYRLQDQQDAAASRQVQKILDKNAAKRAVERALDREHSRPPRRHVRVAPSATSGAPVPEVPTR